MGLGTRLRRCRGGLPRTVWWRADRPPPHRSARSKRRHNRHSEQRKLVELTPYINICDLIRWKAIPHQWDKSYFLEAPFRYGFVKHLVISCETIEIHHHSGYIQPVLLRWIRTGFGCPRPSLTCRCGRSIHRLFFRHGSLACKDCHKLAYASQQQDAITRKRLAASKLRSSSAASQTFASHCPPSLSGSITGPTTKSAKSSISSKHQSKHIASRSRSRRNCSPITSDDIEVAGRYFEYRHHRHRMN